MDAVRVIARFFFALSGVLSVSQWAAAAAVAEDRSAKPAGSLIELSAGDIARLEKLLNVELNALANERKYLDEKPSGFSLVVSIDPVRDAVVIDMGERYGPMAESAELVDLQRLLDNRAVWLLRDFAKFENLYFIYGGKDASFWFPDYGKPVHLRPLDGGIERQHDFRGLGGVSISAGHGRYHHYKWGWIFQRDAKDGNGIQEDLITQDYAESLQVALAACRRLCILFKGDDW